MRITGGSAPRYCCTSVWPHMTARSSPFRPYIFDARVCECDKLFYSKDFVWHTTYAW